jgi:hypothetical protein
VRERVMRNRPEETARRWCREIVWEQVRWKNKVEAVMGEDIVN